MSEYIEIETELSEDGRFMHLYTNLKLTPEAAESYESPDEMAEGSPLAQTLATIEGIATLRIETHTLILTCTPDAPWHAIISDVSAALKDFYL